MMLRSLALRSELVALGGLCVVEDHADRVVLRTPDQPTYFAGNSIMMRTPHADAAREIAQFRADFPQAGHVTITWDLPQVDFARISAAFAPLGFWVDRSDVLTLRGAPVAPPPVAGLTCRTVDSAADWADVLSIEVAVGIEDGHADAPHRNYLAARVAGRQRQVQQGRGAWFGAFLDGQMVGCLGLLHGDGLARYQNVNTRAALRGRGIAAVLVAHAAAWAEAFVPGAVPVMIAETDGAPGRIYRRVGFDRVETIVGVMLPGY